MATKGTAQDRWKRKSWYSVVAPDLFHNVDIGKIIATEPKTVPGKRIDTTVYDVTDDPKKAHMKLLLEITHLEGAKAHTKIREFELVRAYVRSLVRRRITKIEAVISVEGRDGIRLRIKPLIITASKCRSSQKGKIRRAMMRLIFELAKAKTFEEFLTDTIDEKIQKAVREEVKKIYPIKNVDIRRIQIINPPLSVGRPKPEPVKPIEEQIEEAEAAGDVEDEGEESPSAGEGASEKPKKKPSKKRKSPQEEEMEAVKEEGESEEGNGVPEEGKEEEAGKEDIEPSGPS